MLDYVLILMEIFNFSYLANSGGLVSDGGLIQRQKVIMGQQDEMIKEISHGVDRIHMQVALPYGSYDSI